MAAGGRGWRQWGEEAGDVVAMGMRRGGSGEGERAESKGHLQCITTGWCIDTPLDLVHYSSKCMKHHKLQNALSRKVKEKVKREKCLRVLNPHRMSRKR